MANIQHTVVQSLRHVRLFVTPWTAAHQAFLSFTISWSLLKLMSTESMMPSNHLILLPTFPPAINNWYNSCTGRRVYLLRASLQPGGQALGLGPPHPTLTHPASPVTRLSENLLFAILCHSSPANRQQLPTASHLRFWGRQVGEIL